MQIKIFQNGFVACDFNSIKRNILPCFDFVILCILYGETGERPIQLSTNSDLSYNSFLKEQDNSLMYKFAVLILNCPESEQKKTL